MFASSATLVGGAEEAGAAVAAMSVVAGGAVGGIAAEGPADAPRASTLSGEHSFKVSRRQRATGSPVNEIGVDEEGEPGAESGPDEEPVAVPIDIDKSDRLLIGTTGGGGKIVDAVVF